jgi:hypothetical protein
MRELMRQTAPEAERLRQAERLREMRARWGDEGGEDE